ncbi:MAG: hypothetical protein V3V08_09900 [Nannocystaceae bacterium]
MSTDHPFAAVRNFSLRSLFVLTTFPLGCAATRDSAASADHAEESDAWDSDGEHDSNDESSESPGNGDPSENEQTVSFRLPEASGRFVYAASPGSDTVAVIDTSSLAIEVVRVCGRPTVVRSVAASDDAAAAVAVLCQGSDELALLRTDNDGHTTSIIHHITPGANEVAVTPDGSYVFVFHDVDAADPLGPGSDQEVTVITSADATQIAMVVGAHPREIRFSPDASTAYAVTASGVNVIDLTQIASQTKPPLVPVHTDPAIEPSRLEVHISTIHGQAVVRTENEANLVVTDLATREQFTFALPGVATDLDIAADQTFAVVTLPGDNINPSEFAELMLPVLPGSTVRRTAVDNEYVGLAHLAPDGQSIILYTTVMPPPPPNDDSTGDTGDTGDTSDTGDTGTATSGSTGSGTGDTTGDTQDTGAAVRLGGARGARRLFDLALGRFDTVVPTLRHDDPRERVTVVRREGGTWGQQHTLYVETAVRGVGVAPDSNSAILLHKRLADDNVDPWSYTLLDLAKPIPLKKRQAVPAPPDHILITPEGHRAAVLLRDDAREIRGVEIIDLRTFIVERLRLGSPPEGAGYVHATAKIFVSQAHPQGRLTFVSDEGAIQTVTGFQLNDSVKD